MILTNSNQLRNVFHDNRIINPPHFTQLQLNVHVRTIYHVG